MKFPQTLPGSLLMILITVGTLLIGCSPIAAATPLPTQDPATLVAAAVSTLRVQMTEEAFRNPSPTPTPRPTDTPLPTQTPVPPSPTPALPTFTATVAATTAPALSAKFLSAGTYPVNKSEYIPNEKFGLAIRFINTGTITWNPGLRLTLVSFQGEVTVQKEAEVGEAIEPGKAVEFDLWAYGSETLGRHIWYYQLYTGQGIPVPGGSAMFSYVSK